MFFGKISLLVSVVLILLQTGCSVPEVTNTKRSAIETLLLSDAVDKALQQCDLRRFTLKKIYVDPVNLVTDEKNYILGCLYQRIGAQGMIRVTEKKEADFIIDLYCGTLGTEHDKFMIGLPAMAVPIPFAGPVQTPEIPIYRNISQKAFCKLRLSMWSGGSQNNLYSSRYLYSVSYFNRCILFGIPYKKTNLPSYESAISKSDKQKGSELEKRLQVKVEYYPEDSITMRVDKSFTDKKKNLPFKSGPVTEKKSANPQ